ncbi:MAG TPA: hypothetical protein VFU43_21000 [Streptosporangiaceae bacterium]|nr:hypothetical protein [Streptosporangiaceae bacterium]
MVTHIWRRRRAEAAPDDTRTAEPAEPAAPSGRQARLRRIVTGRRPVEAVPQTVLVDRRTARRWRGHRHNPVSSAIWAAAWAAAVVLGLGILLTWANANPANDVVQPVMRMAQWLGSPFNDAFLNPDPKQRLYAEWGVAAGAYLLIGRVLSWLTRW